MAIANFTIDLNGGDIETIDTLLTYKIYGNLDSYTTPIAINGSHVNDPNVTVSNGIATITSVDVGQNTAFKVKTVDEALNESLISDIYVVSTITPVLSSFRIIDDTVDDLSRVYFDASSDISDLSITGFNISGKTVLSVTIDLDGLGGYFTVSSAFTFWDNNTIRLESGDGTVYDFTMQYISNNISEPAATDHVYYVDAAVGSSGAGTSEATAFKTFAEGLAAVEAQGTPEGSTIFVKAGNYTVTSVTCQFTAIGTADKPIKIIGYKKSTGGVPDAITTNYWDISSPTLLSTEMPIITGNVEYEALSIRGNYTIIRNIQAQNHLQQIELYGNITGAIIDNCNVSGGTYGLEINTQLMTMPQQKIRVINSNFYNHEQSAIRVVNDYSLIKDNKVYNSIGGQVSTDGTDYYIVIDGGSNNIVTNNFVKKLTQSGHGGHGISIKASGEVSEYNLLQLNEIVNIGLPLQARHPLAKYGVYKDNWIYKDVGWTWPTGGLTPRDNSSYNIFERNIVDGTNEGIRFYESSEVSSNKAYPHHNKFINNIFKNTYYGITTQHQTTPTPSIPTAALYNDFVNNTFYGQTYLHWANDTINNTNTFKNSMVINVQNIKNGSGTHDFVYDYNNFFGTSGQWSLTAALGANYTNIDPNFVDTTNFVPQATFTSIDVPKITGVNYDYNAGERVAQTTVGAVKHADETV